ncbi:c-type cytochrome [Bradyrhizobium sp.]|mgnify:CR=1 FL=1|uniref:c-type cytochrome n=1 Tax=Bradyrhizobium sp. TaxID=376 RepID=UPI002B90CB15|nr:c-type cytochrome [Bradyrhizobium sp.]HMM90323.1 cytochrome c [Bradyrhizobium sp.]
MSGLTLRMFAASACLVLLSGAAAQALDAQQRRAGATLENLCGRCHAVGTTGDSPNPLAPAFRTFGEKLYDTDMVQRLQDGLTTIHPEMPTFRFKRDDAAAAVNYLRAIQRKR